MFSRVWLFVTPWTVARWAPLSIKFSRQVYWKGLPCRPPGDLSDSGIEPRSPTLQADSLLSESLGKPKNTGVSSLSLLQGNFSTQGSNPGPPHCRQILYQLSHQGSPHFHLIRQVHMWKSKPRNVTGTVLDIFHCLERETLSFPCFPRGLTFMVFIKGCHHDNFPWKPSYKIAEDRRKIQPE